MCLRFSTTCASATPIAIKNRGHGLPCFPKSSIFGGTVKRDFRNFSTSKDSAEVEVLDKLKVIIDPDLHQDIVSLGFVKDLKIEGGEVSFVLELTTPACPVREEFKASAQAAVKLLSWVTKVEVTLSSKKKIPRPATDQANNDAGSCNNIFNNPFLHFVL
jgi:metal-sulfur cluster biosynthetic enzyme